MLERGEDQGQFAKRMASSRPPRHAADAIRPRSIPILRRRGVLWVALSVLLILVAGGSFALFFRNGLSARSEHVVLRLRGSTSLGDELMPKLGAAFLHDEMGAVETGIRVVARDAKGHTRFHVWGRVPGIPGLQIIEIYSAGSSAAFACLAVESGPDSCDIGMASRPITNIDKQTYPVLRNLGIRSTEHVIAIDGIAIIVNPQNPVTQLSVPQLRAIYAGKITNWKEVGGNDARIDLYGRDRDSGTLAMFTEKVMRQESLANTAVSAVPADHEIGDSELMIDTVMRSPNAIGYVTHAMTRDAKVVPMSDGTGPAFLPTEETIVSEEYPICRRLLLYHWDAPGSLTDAFVRYAVSKPGQAVVIPTIYVELPPRVLSVIPPNNAPAAYREITAKYLKVTLNFHFASEQIDTTADPNSSFEDLAKVNVIRLRTYLSQHGGTGADILLVGFADGYEGSIHNQNLARMRAESIATNLRAIGVIVPSENIRDFGSELPVASNETPEGRGKNRRVEVWVRKGL